MSRAPSLKRRLIVLPVLTGLVTLLLGFGVLLAIALRLDVGGQYTEEDITREAARALVRQPDGGLKVEMTPALQALDDVSPGLWFVARDAEGRTVSHGDVPRQFDSLIPALGEIAYANFRDRNAPYRLSAVVRNESGPAGTVTVLGQGKLGGLNRVIAIASNLAVLPITLVFAIVLLITMPWIVRRTLAGVARTAKEAEQIDVDRRGLRLSEHEVPREIVPLVRAVNEALARLDEGYERQQRFIASAAHELRTPVAILRLKIDASGDEAVQRLSGEVARLATLAEQLLDLQRLDHVHHRERVDLGDLARAVAADMAPLLIAAGKSIEVQVLEQVHGAQPVTAHLGAIERVLNNLVHNAVEHGGQRVTVRVDGTSFEVEDDGPGIPAEERDRVFEAFHRLRPRAAGTGLGLSLVRQVVQHHEGRVAILDAPGGGTCVRVTLPPA